MRRRLVAVVSAFLLAVTVLAGALSATQQPQAPLPPPPVVSLGEALRADVEAVAAALEDIRTVSGTYPASLYWFEASTLGVELNALHRVAWYEPGDDAYRVCVSSTSGRWMLFDSGAGDVVGDGSSGQPLCIADGEPEPSARDLAARRVEAGAAAIVDVVETFRDEMGDEPRPGEVRAVAKQILGSTERLASLDLEDGISVCVESEGVSAVFGTGRAVPEVRDGTCRDLRM